MPLTSDQLKTVITSEIDVETAYQTEVDTLWPFWVDQTGGVELLLRKRLLTFLQGRYRRRYNTTSGRDNQQAYQQFLALTQMLKQVDADLAIEKADTVPVLGVTRLRPAGTCYVDDEAYLTKTNGERCRRY